MDGRIAQWVKTIETMVAKGWTAEKALAKIHEVFGLTDEQIRLVQNWYNALVTA